MRRFVAFTSLAVFVVLLAIERQKRPVPKSVEPLAAGEMSDEGEPPSESSEFALSERTSDTNLETAPIRSTPENPWREKLVELIRGREALFGPAGERNLMALRDFVTGIATINLPSVLNELQELQALQATEFGKELQLHLLRSWAESDVHSAAKWISRIPIGTDRLELAATVAGAWATQSIADAKAWAEQLPDIEERHVVLTRIATDTAYNHPIESLQVSLAEMQQSLDDGPIGSAIASWTRLSPDDALSWAKQISDAEYREQAMSVVASAVAEKDPASAASVIADSFRPGPLRNQTALAVIRRWMQTDTAGAVAWVAWFPEGSLREDAIALLDESPKYNRSTP